MPTGPDFLSISMASALSSKSSTTWRAVTAAGRICDATATFPLAAVVAPSRAEAIAPTSLMPICPRQRSQVPRS